MKGVAAIAVLITGQDVRWVQDLGLKRARMDPFDAFVVLQNTSGVTRSSSWTAKNAEPRPGLAYRVPGVATEHVRFVHQSTLQRAVHRIADPFGYPHLRRNFGPRLESNVRMLLLRSLGMQSALRHQTARGVAYTAALSLREDNFFLADPDLGRLPLSCTRSARASPRPSGFRIARSARQGRP